MRFLTLDAKLVCKHELGSVGLAATQQYVTVANRPVLVEPNPENRPIANCPNININIKPCQHTLVVNTGYSAFIRIDGKRVCLDTVVGLTDGTPPGVVQYKVNDPGQTLVAELA